MRHFTLIFILLISIFSSAAENLFWQKERGTSSQMALMAETLTEQNCNAGNMGMFDENEVQLDATKFRNADGSLDQNPVGVITPGAGDPKEFCNQGKINLKGCSWAKPDTKMYKVGEAEKETYDPETKSNYKQKFLKVRYCYYREYKNEKGEYAILKKEEDGWIEDDITYMPNAKLPEIKSKLPPPINVEPVKTFNKTADPCPDDELAKIQDFGIGLQAKIVTSVTDPKGRLSHIAIADKLANQIGECPLSNPQVFDKPWPKSNNVYDEYILPKLRAKEQSFKALTAGMTDENGKPLNINQIIEIDSLARLLYAEMGLRCYDDGTQYAETVARIVLNRDEDLQSEKTRRYAESRFLATSRVDHDPNKSTLAMVMATNGQFSFWNKNVVKKNAAGIPVPQINHQGLTQGLCPPSRPDAKFAAGRPPDNLDKAVWRDYVRIATRAVLFKNQFKQDTAAINVRHYSSTVDINNYFPKPPPGKKPMIYPEVRNAKITGLNYTPIDPSKVPQNDTAFMDMLNKITAEKKISNPACLRLWDDTPERKLYAN